MPLNLVCIWVQTLDPYERKRGVNVDMGPRFGPISTPGQEIPLSPNMKVRQPGQSSESFSPDISYINGSLHSLNFPEPAVQQSGARRAFQARARRSARSVAAGGRIIRLRCRRPAIFKQSRSVFGLSVLPVCNFQADQDRFWAFSAGGLQFLSRPPAISALQFVWVAETPEALRKSGERGNDRRRREERRVSEGRYGAIE